MSKYSVTAHMIGQLQRQLPKIKDKAKLNYASFNGFGKVLSLASLKAGIKYFSPFLTSCPTEKRHAKEMHALFPNIRRARQRKREGGNWKLLTENFSWPMSVREGHAGGEGGGQMERFKVRLGSLQNMLPCCHAALLGT